MAVVPWTYNNPYVDRKAMERQFFHFSSGAVEVFQDVSVSINVLQNTAYKIWDGSYLLAKYLDSHKVFPKGFWTDKTCIELGAGSALVSLSAWLLGAKVVATDMEAYLAHTSKCIQRNRDGITRDTDATLGEIEAVSYSWGDDPAHLFPPYDVILGSDIIYHPSLVHKLLSSIEVLSDSHTMIFISYKKRGLGEDIFFEAAKKHGFQVNRVPKDDHPQEFSGSDYDILNMIPQNGDEN